MSITPEQLDNWFSYHAPTDETAPKYAAIRQSETAAHDGFGIVESCVDEPVGVQCGNINALTRQFAVIVDNLCPDSADKSAAIRCIRLARNAANEGVMVPGSRSHLFTIAHEQLQYARWQANSAIACGGK